MAGTLKVNGVAVNVVGWSNTVTIPWSNPMTIEWSGWPTSGGSQIILDISDNERTSCFTFSGNAGTSPCYGFYLDFTGNDSAVSSWLGYYHAYSSGSLSVSSTKNFEGKRLSISYNNNAQSEDGGCTITFSQAKGKCGAPSNVKLASGTSTGSKVKLSWSAGSAGTNNSITGYKIQRRLYQDESFSDWADLTTTNSSTLSLDVDPPSSAYGYYYYRVLTMGSAGSSYYSDYAYCSDNLERIPYLGAPSISSYVPSGTSLTVNFTPAAHSGYGNEAVLYSLSVGSQSASMQSTTTSGTLSLQVSGLTKGSAYTVSLSAQYGKETSSTSGSYTMPTECGAPSSCSLSAQESTGENVTLSWGAGSAGTGNSITGYKIQRRQYSDESFTEWADLAETDANTRALSVAPPSGAYVEYQYRVLTKGSAGSSYYSGYTYSGYLTRIPVINPPTNLSVSFGATRGSAIVNWTQGNCSGYSSTPIYSCYTGSNYGTVNAAQTSAAFSGLSLGTQYTFIVKVQYGKEERSATVSGTVPAIASAPSNLRLSAGESTGGAVTLSWSAGAGASGNSLTGYKIQRRLYADESFGAWEDLDTVGSAVTSLSVSPPSAAYTAYYYRACTMGSAGAGYYSSYAEITGQSVLCLIKIPYLSAPSNLAVSMADPYTARITWDASSYSGYTGSPTYEASAGGVSEITSGLSADLAGLSRGQTYTFVVTASYGKEIASASISYTIPTPQITTVPVITITRYYDHFHLEWTAAQGENGGANNFYYRVLYGKAGNKRENSTSWGTGRAADIYGIDKDVAYYFVIEVNYNDVVYGYSNEVSSTIPSPSVTAPTGVVVSHSNGVITVAWDASSGSWGSGNVEYRVEYGDQNSGYDSAFTLWSTATSTTINSWVQSGSLRCGFTVHARYSDGLNYGYNEATIVYKVIYYLGPPGAPIVSQNGDVITFSWAASESGLSTVYYFLDYYMTASGAEGDEGEWNYVGTGTSYQEVINHDFFGRNMGVKVMACDSQSETGEEYRVVSSVTVQFIGIPSVDAPVLSIGPYHEDEWKGKTMPLEWSAAALNYLSGSIRYDLYVDDVMIIQGISSPAEIDASLRPAIKTWMDVDVFIRAVCGAYSADSNIVAFQYSAGHWTVKVFTGGQFKKAVMYAWSGSAWVEIAPEYFSGGEFNPCSHDS